MYSNYIRLGESYGYKIEIIDIICSNNDELTYFNKRSSHKVPMSFSKNVYNDWDDDEFSTKIEAYIGDFNGPPPGDSMPSFPPKTKEELDYELEEIMKNTTNK